MKLAFLSAVLLTVGQWAVATETSRKDEKFYTVRAPVITLVDKAQHDLSVFADGIGKEACGSRIAPSNSGNSGNPIDEVDVIIDKIINLGKKVWAVIELGRPVVNLKSDVATALPEGAKCWSALTRWKNPDSQTYKMVFKNTYGVEVVSFEYRIIYLHSGEVNGKGKYIGYATSVPANIRVLYGFNLNVNTVVPTVYNMGSSSNPVAGMQMDLKWQLSTVASENRGTVSYVIDGNGGFKRLK
jgi:hypothetical protein